VRGIGEKLASSLVARYGSLDQILEAATSTNPGVALGKVRRDIDYVRRAARVATIPTDLPIAEVDLARPRHEPADSLYSVADQAGLGGALRRLVKALTA
jgi:5'-3' exonuclease